MKVAVTSTGTDPNSQMDPRFGRARYILVFNPDGTLNEAIDNQPNVAAMQGAGIQAAKILADRKIDVLITGFCGPNAFRTLQAGGIKVVVEQSGTVQQALSRFKNNEVGFAEQPNAEAHW